MTPSDIRQDMIGKTFGLTFVEPTNLSPGDLVLDFRGESATITRFNPVTPDTIFPLIGISAHGMVAKLVQL